MNSTNINSFNNYLVAAQIEDKIWNEFEVELKEIIRYSQNINDKEIESKYNELRNSIESIHHLNESLFK